MFLLALKASNHFFLNKAHRDQVSELEEKNGKKFTWLQKLKLKFHRGQKA